MARILWLNWAGGGNLPPSLGIARVLTERGHTVAFAGRPEMVPRVEVAGLRAIEFAQAYAQVDRYPQGHPMSRAACYLTSPAVAEEAKTIVETEAPDLVLIDGMFPAALAQAADFVCQTIAVCHQFCFRIVDRWRNTNNTMLNGMRQQAGFPGLPELDRLWLDCDRIIVTTLGEFDSEPLPGWESVRHVGPVLEDEKVAIPIALPWPEDDSTPLVLMSFSTGFEQRSVQKLQNGLDALADLPVHVVVTTGGIVDPAELKPSANAVVFKYAAHDPILRSAALSITHGVPMVLIPGLAHDQAPNAAIMQQWGTGVALPSDAGSSAIREAAQQVLSTPSYRQNAQLRSSSLKGVDGAANAANEIEAVLAISPVAGAKDRTSGQARQFL
jgi:UDP:flavonoid glycosyltransferase YjiC (YdhE family)